MPVYVDDMRALSCADCAYLNGWRKMDSAPKDGSKILVHMRDNDDLSPVIVCWSMDAWTVAWDGSDICKEWGDEPRCWQPMPEPPPAER